MARDATPSSRVRGRARTWALPRCAVVAHRGASTLQAENTLQAIRLALEIGAHAIEVDVKRTADGELVLMHDATLQRTTGLAKPVHRTPYGEIARLDAGRNFVPYVGPYAVPRLEEVLHTVDQRAWLNLELTNYPSPLDDLPERTAALLQALGYTEKVWVSSFNPLALWRFHRRLPEVPLALLLLPKPWMTRWLPPLLAGMPLVALHLHRRLLPYPLWKTWQARGYRVLFYTLNHAQALRQAFTLQADGVFTDVPGRALSLREHLRPCQASRRGHPGAASR